MKDDDLGFEGPVVAEAMDKITSWAAGELQAPREPAR